MLAIPGAPDLISVGEIRSQTFAPLTFVRVASLLIEGFS